MRNLNQNFEKRHLVKHRLILINNQNSLNFNIEMNIKTFNFVK